MQSANAKAKYDRGKRLHDQTPPLMSDQDIRTAGLRPGQRIRLLAADGSFTGRVRPAPIKPGNLEVHWPEGNVLLSGAAIDARSKEPDYNTTVTIELLQDE